MNENVKKQIIKALIDYSKDNSLNSEQLRILTDVSKSYIEAMLSKSLTSGKTMIGDVHFSKVAEAIGFNLNPVYWKHVDTVQYSSMFLELMDAKARREEKVIIGQSRSGKTYTLGLFKKKYPQHTYIVTVSDLHTLPDILDDICLQMGITPKGNKVSKLRKIATKVKELRLKGQKPILIIDEAENLKLPPLKMIKALYDAFENNCPIVLIGTEQLLENFDGLKDAKRNSIPQLYYRFVAGVRLLSDIDKEKMFAPFLDLVEDENLKVMLYNLCDNYGMLNKYIMPALREANELGKPLTEQLFLQKNKHLI